MSSPFVVQGECLHPYDETGHRFVTWPGRMGFAGLPDQRWAAPAKKPPWNDSKVASANVKVSYGATVAQTTVAKRVPEGMTASPTFLNEKSQAVLELG